MPNRRLTSTHLCAYSAPLRISAPRSTVAAQAAVWIRPAYVVARIVPAHRQRSYPAGFTLEVGMETWTPDPTFYPSPRLAADAPPERLAYVASFAPARRRNDEMAVVDLGDGSLTYGQIIRRVEMPGT